MNARRGLARACVAALLAIACVVPAARAQSGDPAAGAIEFYQRWLSDMRHMHCRFTPSCSQYAKEAIAAYGLVEGSARAADRLMRCSSAAESRYARNDDGLLSDPATGVVASPSGVHAPSWLRPEVSAAAPPASSRLGEGRRERLAEALEFGLQLEARGDCERASAEFQRAGALADTLPAEVWAFARAGDGYAKAGQWFLADRAYLTAAMLADDARTRADVGYRAAVCRFDAGAYVACANLLADPVLTPEGVEPIVRAGEEARSASLLGLCAIALGEWDVADRALARSALATFDGASRARDARLRECVASGRALRGCSPALAGALSVVLPGAGQAYSGHGRDGFRHLLFNSALIYTVAALATREQVPAAVVAGGFALPFYVGNVLGARESARRLTRERHLRLLARAIEDTNDAR